MIKQYCDGCGRELTSCQQKVTEQQAYGITHVRIDLPSVALPSKMLCAKCTTKLLVIFDWEDPR